MISLLSELRAALEQKQKDQDLSNKVSPGLFAKVNLTNHFCS